MSPLVRADIQVAETYVYEAGDLLHCPIFAIGGSEDPLVDIEELEGWRSVTAGDFSLQIIQGRHFFLHESQSQLISAVLPVLRKHAGLQRTL